MGVSPGGRTGGPLCRRLLGMRTRARGDPVSAGGCRCPHAHCAVDLICVLLPQGGQGPERSDIGLGAPAGLI